MKLTINGKLLGGKVTFNPAQEFDRLDEEKCGYIGFNDMWPWLQARVESVAQAAAGASKGGVFGGGKAKAAAITAASEFCLNDILSVQERVMLSLFERYEGRNSRNNR